MGRIAFFSIPAQGHTNPTLGLVKILIAEGYIVDYYSFDEYQERIEETGANFYSCSNYHKDIGLVKSDSDRIGKDLVFATKVLVKEALGLDKYIVQALNTNRPDLIIGDSMAIWAKGIAYKLHIPFISSTTTFAINNNVAKMMNQGFKDMINGISAYFKTKKDVKRLSDIGYPFKNVLDIISNKQDVDTIVYTSRYFQPYNDEFNQTYYNFIGPMPRPSKNEYHKTANKLIYISLGTVANNRPEFFNNCIKAFKDSPYEVVISVGDIIDLNLINNDSDNIHIYQSVDQTAVLAKADLFLSHCGMNSVNEAMYVNVPIICYPQTPEQCLVANRVCELKAGLRLNNLDVDEIKKLSEEILNNSVYKENANKVSKSFSDRKDLDNLLVKIKNILNEA